MKVAATAAALIAMAVAAPSAHPSSDLSLDLRASQFGGDLYVAVGGGDASSSEYRIDGTLTVVLDHQAGDCGTDRSQLISASPLTVLFDSGETGQAVDTDFYMEWDQPADDVGKGTVRACALLAASGTALSRTVVVRLPDACSGSAQRIIGGRNGQFVRLRLTGTVGATCDEGKAALRTVLQQWRRSRSGPLRETRSMGARMGYTYFYGPVTLRGLPGSSVVYHRIGSDIGRFQVSLGSADRLVEISEYHEPTVVYLASCRTKVQRRSKTCQ